MYIDKFILPIDEEEKIISHVMVENGGTYGYIDNPYPCGVFSNKKFKQLDFSPITILYGGNGSGKSTLLNLIALKLNLKRVSPYNTSETFSEYAKRCKYELSFDDYGEKSSIPINSRIITSDDVFDYMLAIRTNNDEISEKKNEAKEDYAIYKYGNTIKMQGLQDYEKVRNQVLARSKTKSRRQFLKNEVGQEIKLNSNGETALSFFDMRLKNDAFYCLDEPENSLSPKMQIKLVDIISELARYCGCQFVIATHSPFLLAIEKGKIYNLDSNPVTINKWWELENTKSYFEFFFKYKDLFLK